MVYTPPAGNDVNFTFIGDYTPPAGDQVHLFLNINGGKQMTKMWTVIIKNNDVSDYLIEDLGISVVSSGIINFHEQFTYDEIAGSDDLRTAISGSNLVVNDGTTDLSTTSGVDYLTLENIYHLEDNYYDKTELETSGQSQVHWENLTDVPPGMEGNTLDVAYDEGGPGAGRAITVDAGAVKFDATVSGSYAPLELTELSTLPVSGLAGGQLGIKDGILYTYDSNRSKWLSVQRMFLSFGRRGKTKDQYLNYSAGTLTSNNSGYRLARNATIVSMTGQLDTSGSCDVRVRKNDGASNIATLNISSSVGNSDTTADVDVSADDYLQSYLDSSSKVEDPMLVIEVAWRE